MAKSNLEVVQKLPEGKYVAFITAGPEASNRLWGLVSMEVSRITKGQWNANNVMRAGEFEASKSQLEQVAQVKGVKVIRPVKSDDKATIANMMRQHIVGFQPLV